MMALTRAPAALQSADVARSLSPHLFSQKIQTIKCPHPSRSLRFHYTAPSEPHTISMLRTLTRKLKNSAVRTMAPKSAPPAVKQQLILDWFHKSLSAHSFKDLEKALPGVASISGMVVKDYLQALSDEGLIRVEKIGSGNWYWAFVSDAKNGKDKVLNDLRKEEEKLKRSMAEVDGMITEEEAKREDEGDDEMLEDDGPAMSREALLEADERLRKEVKALDAELKTYSGNDPTELLKQKKQTELLKQSAIRWTDNIESVCGHILQLSQDRSAIASLLLETCGEEYVPGEGLKDLD